MTDSRYPTQERLREMLHYDPDTGQWTWLRRTGGQCRAGGPAGSISHQGYLVITLDRKCNEAHRLAFIYMTGQNPAGVIDHIDRNRSNCSWSNLRVVDRAANSQNRGMNRNKKSCQFLGVTRVKSGKWMAQIRANKITHYLGVYDTPEIAHAAYMEAKARLH